MNSNSRPVIGIVPSFDDGTTQFGDGVDRVFLRRDYLETLSNVGALPIILNPDMLIDEIIDLCDGIVISGGGDIDPSFYNEERLDEVVRVEPQERFEWESKLIAACDKAVTPVLGICYGMQRLNVYYGGSLLQDIEREYPESIGHNNTKHTVYFTHNFLSIQKGSLRDVASRHHQAIARLADGFEVVATAPDGIIEAIRGHRQQYGMQWHPESDETGAHVYRAFVEQCMRRGAPHMVIDK